MKTSTLLLGALAAAFFSTAAQAQDLPTQKVLTFDVADAMAHAALDRCRGDGYKISVLVVDGTNTLKAFLHDDDGMTGTVDLVRLKVNSVMAFGHPSEAFAKAGPPFLPTMVNFPGAIPIKVGTQLVGAIGVSGAPSGEKDAACATAGLAAVADN